MANFLPAEIIKKKRRGLELEADELEFIVNSYVKEALPDYQMAALLMAIFFKGLSTQEMSKLTELMRDSGYKFHFPELHAVDKHSTGGVGDKTSMILAPIAAACGVPVPMIGGRGLGHTGGTLDKLEAIPGFRCDLSKEEFKDFVGEHNIALIGQTDDICPADKKMYALRDVTGTVESIGLICASIMSKKLAEGISSLVLDVKCGSGAFMKTLEEATALASNLISIGENNQVHTLALITNMNQPLGKFIGNALEIHECIEILKNQQALEKDFDFYEDTRELSLELAAHMVFASEKAPSLNLAREKTREVLKNGQALKVFEELCQRQGGHGLYDLPQAKNKYEVLSPKEGFIRAINTEGVGLASLLLGAGRKTKTDEIDPAAGIELHFKQGFEIKKDQKLFTLYYDNDKPAEEAARQLLNTLKWSSEKPASDPLIFKTLSKKDL